MIPSAQLAALRNARHLVVFTGAGVSAESGIPTFRDSLTGLWQRFDAATLATPEAYEQDPALVWGWYEWRRMQVLKAQPNAAHRAIAALVQQVPRLTLVTQNVDDLHERAGSSDVIHLHGSLHHHAAWSAAGSRASPCRRRTSRRKAVAFRRRAANTAMASCARAWSGLARACRAARWTMPLPLRGIATC